MKDKLDKQVLHTIRRFEMVRPQEKVLVALSGGPDSLCLLAVLAALRAELAIEIEAVHVDHGLRPESADEAARVQDLCARFGVTCHLRRVDVSERVAGGYGSVQEAARDLRYAACYEVADAVDAHRVAMGHTADDQAETVLMRLLRGAGPTGLAGIPPVRGMIIRPLISVWREQILAYCRSCHLPFIEDASNRSDKYLRNRIRHHLVPYLEREYNPKVREALWRLAEVLRADEEYFDAEVAERYGSPQLAGEDGPGWARVRAAGLRSLPLALQRRVLRHAYARATGRMAPSFERLEAALALAGPRARGGSIVELGAGAYATRRGPWVELHAEAPAAEDKRRAEKVKCT